MLTPDECIAELKRDGEMGRMVRSEIIRTIREQEKMINVACENKCDCPAEWCGENPSPKICPSCWRRWLEKEAQS